MRSPVDALRSVARYTAVTLGPDWEVRLSSEKGTFHRPYARVVQIPSIQMLTEHFHTSKFIASYQVVAYPVAGVEADASQLAALTVVDQLWVAFAGPGAGAPHVRTPADSQRGRPYRIPLYDYQGVSLTAGVDETARANNDFLKVEGPPEVQLYQDPADELLWSVAANIRMSWLRFAAVSSTQPTVSDVPVGAQTNG